MVSLCVEGCRPKKAANDEGIQSSTQKTAVSMDATNIRMYAHCAIIRVVDECYRTWVFTLLTASTWKLYDVSWLVMILMVRAEVYGKYEKELELDEAKRKQNKNCYCQFFDKI